MFEEVGGLSISSIIFMILEGGYSFIDISQNKNYDFLVVCLLHLLFCYE